MLIKDFQVYLTKYLKVVLILLLTAYFWATLKATSSLGVVLKRQKNAIQYF